MEINSIADMIEAEDVYMDLIGYLFLRMVAKTLKPGEEHDTSVVRLKIAEVGESVVNLLIEKNKAYGNSALNPVRIFSKSDAIEQINVRIDDKLSRIMRGTGA